MPQVIPVLAATAFTVGGVAVSYGAILQASVIALGVGRGIREQRKLARQINASLQDRTTPVRQSDAARTIVYGRTRVSGPIVYHKTHGARQEIVSHVIPIAGHEIAAIDDVWFNDKTITPWSAGPVSSGSPYFVSRQVSIGHRWTGGAPGSVVTLPASAAEPLVAVDTVSYSDVTVVEGGTGDGYFRVEQAREVQLVAGLDYTVGGTPSAPTITLQASAAGANGKPITATYRVDRGNAYASVYAFLGGASGQRDTNLETWSGGEWASTAIGCNVARLHVRTDWQETLYATGFPGVSAIVRGKKVYDPRLDSTNGGSGSHRADTPSTWAYSDNPALCAVDYLRDAMGFGCASSEIDWPSVIAAANVCDELVPIDGVGGTHKRYTVAGVLSTETDRKTNLEAILDAMVGIAVYSGGKWTIRAGAYVTPTLDLDESDLAGGDITVQARANRRDLFNAVRGRYRAPDQLYQVTDFPPYASSTYATEDGGETIYREIDLQMVDDARRAQRIAKLILYRARQALTIQASFKLSAYALQPGDTCRLSIARYGWTNKVFRVIRREFSSLSVVRLTLQEDASAIYAWGFNEATTPDPAPNTSLPDPRYVPVPSGIVFRSDETTFYVRPDASVVPYAEVSWTLPTADDVHVEVFWKRTNEMEYRRIVCPIGATYAWLEDVRNGDVVNVYLYAVNAIGARSQTFWRPSYRVASVVQDNVGGVAVNWIENATCVNSIDGWVLGSGANPNLFLRHTTASLIQPEYVLAGTPEGKGSGWHLIEANDRPANGVTDAWVGQPGKIYPVIAGQRIEGSFYLCTHRCTADVRVAFYSVTGAYITEHVLWGPGSVNDGSTLQSLAQYGRRGGFTTVPAGAVRAMPFVRKYGRNAGVTANGSYVFATNAMLGPALDGQADFSPWSDGPLRSIQAADLVPGAAGESYARDAAADIALPLNRCDSPLVQFSLAEINAREGDHLVYRVTGTVSNTDLVRVALTPTLFTDQFGQPKRSSEWATLIAGADQPYIVEGAFTVPGPGKSTPTVAFYASTRTGVATLHRARLVVQIRRR